MTTFSTQNEAGSFPIGRGRGVNDDAIQQPDYRTTYPYSRDGLLQEVDVTWTRSSMLGSGGQDGIVSGAGGILHADCQRWEWNFPPTGCHVRKVVSGVVRNSSGVGVAGATVQLFNTSTGLLVDTQTTASDGSYTCGDPNAVSCFAIAYLPGSPDTAGTTVNTVAGT